MESSQRFTTVLDTFCQGSKRSFDVESWLHRSFVKSKLLSFDVVVEAEKRTVRLRHCFLLLHWGGSDVKVEDDVPDNTSGSAVQQSPAASISYELLQISKKSVIKVYDFLHQRLLEAVNQSNENTSSDMTALLNPSYSTRRISEL